MPDKDNARKHLWAFIDPNDGRVKVDRAMLDFDRLDPLQRRVFSTYIIRNVNIST